MPTIEYSVAQKRCFEARAKNLQIVAGAGSGKTETISRRCATLIKKGASPDAIVAFTFTNNAAMTLMSRIESHITDMLGAKLLSKLSRMFIGTIHSYCFQLLQEHDPKYGMFEVADEHKLAGLLSKEYENIGLDRLSVGQHWETTLAFLRNVDLVENELIPAERISNESFGKSLQKFRETLFDYRVLTFGQLISLTLEMLEKKEIYNNIVPKIEHVIVDEYQDINPAQEKLIEILSSGSACLTVVGDDLQSIYQWRGSTVESILTFEDRRSHVQKETLSVNYRSRPGIIRLAADFSNSISPKLEKKMIPFKEKGDVEYCVWSSDSPQAEAVTIAEAILSLTGNGWSYGDMAILLRSVRTSSEPFVSVFQSMGIPFQCGGRTGLFLQPEAHIFAMTYAWLINEPWKFGPFDRNNTSINSSLLLDRYASLFELNGQQSKALKMFLVEWKADASVGPPKSLVRDFYLLLELLAVREWDLNNSHSMNRMGTVARFSQLLADFEYSAFRRLHSSGRRHIENFYYRIFNYLQYYALSAYEGHPGEASYEPNAVTISTVHQAKGLEWPIVFVPCLTSSRFPSCRTGTKDVWFVDDGFMTPEMRERYEGAEVDERRLFFVAMTRAKETLYLSTFTRLNKVAKPSPFILECNSGRVPPKISELPISCTASESPSAQTASFGFSVSQVSMFSDCPFAFRLRDLFGFAPPLATELGYGRAIHHILRRVAEHAMRCGRMPDESHFTGLLTEEFYLPYATRAAFSRMKAASAESLSGYIHKYRRDFLNICHVEYPVRLFLPSCTISGRADALLATEKAELILLDFKTSVRQETIEKYVLQQSIYSQAAVDSGLDVTRFYIDDIKTRERYTSAVTKGLLEETKKKMNNIVRDVVENRYESRPGVHCRRCDVRWLCKHRRKSGGFCGQNSKTRSNMGTKACGF